MAGTEELLLDDLIDDVVNGLSWLPIYTSQMLTE